MTTVYQDGVTPLDAAHMNAFQQKVEKAAANGYPSLDGTGKVPVAQLPGTSIPAVVNGQWVKGVGGAAVWSAITPADVGLPKISYSAAVPASPADGDLWYLPVGSGVVWGFRYNAGSSSAYKWEFIGGPSLFATGSNGAYTTVTASPAAYVPSISVPRAGDYDAEGTSQVAGVTGHTVQCGVGGPAGAGSAYQTVSIDVTSANYGGVSTYARIAGLNANDAVTHWYSGTTTQEAYANGVLRVKPVRVS